MAASILYYPDFIHVSFVAPFLLIVVARVVHGLLKRVRVEVRVAFAAMLVVALIAKGSGNVIRAWAAAPERPRLFAYPADAWLYLAVPAENPTPYSLLIPGYNTPQQFTDAIAAIERRHAPYLVLLTGLLHDDDPILGYARQRFEPVATPWPYTVYRRAR